MKMCSDVMDLVEEEYHEPQSIEESNSQELASTLAKFADLLKASSEELTETEISNCNLQYYLGKALTLRLQQTSPSASAADPNKADFENAVQSIQGWLNDTAKERDEHPFTRDVIVIAEKPIAPSWQYLHAAFSTLESLQGISLFLAGQTKISWKTKKPFTLPFERRSAIQRLVEKIEKSIHDSARTLKANLNALGVLGQMIDTVFGRSADSGSDNVNGSNAFGKELERLPDAETVAELFCGEVRESWEDALDGVLSVKVKRYK